MQPPPRKGNYAKFLKNLHSEQLSKLLAKNQHECDLLEDIRTFILKRSAIEKSYSDALLKISSGYLNKKIPNIPDIKLDGGEEKWNMWNVWRTVLEENEKLARARLAAVEVFQQQIADDAKILRAYKLQTSRKIVDNLSIVQKELQTCVQDVDRTKKFYFDEEHSAHDVRDKARDIEEKLKKKKGSFFQSITSLQKNSAKFSSKREQLEEKSSGARNDYLMCLAAANAHQNRYFLVDLQLAMTSMESNVFEKVAEYLTLMGRTELLTCSAMQNSFGIIRDQAKQLTREYNLQCIYLYYPVLKQHIQYEFEPCDNDPINYITAEHESAVASLSKEARRWAMRIARENNNVKDALRKLQIYNALRESGQKVDPNDQNGPDLETKMEDLKQNIRRAETAKMKAEARLECLRAGGINVDEWLQEAETLNVQEIQRSTSSLSIRTEVSGTGDHPSSDSFYDSDYVDGEVNAASSEKVVISQEDQFDNQEVDAMLEQERQKIEQLTAGWEDPTKVDWSAEESAFENGSVTEKQGSFLAKCTALYSYTAQNPDELTIVENEQLEVVGEGDGDGWVRARNYRGEEGYVPHNYLDIDSEQPSATPGLTAQISFSSVDYTMNTEEEPAFKKEKAAVEEYRQPDILEEPKMNDFGYCIALYDYEGDGPEELTFEEGQVIKILSKCAHSVDDGWWKGTFDDKMGNFPSLVVEECDEYGEPLTNQMEDTPPTSAPPVFTPPEVPELVVNVSDNFPSPPDVEELEKCEFKVQGKPATSDLNLELSKSQQEQYGTQFQNNVIPTVSIRNESDEIEDDSPNKNDDAFGLEVAQIVITAATPMLEDGGHGFPAIEESDEKSDCDEEDEEAAVKETRDEEADCPSHKKDESRRRESDPKKVESSDPPKIAGSSAGSEGETTDPSGTENSFSQAIQSEDMNEIKQVVGGRASIPEELEPDQLARLQDLRESNA